MPGKRLNGASRVRRVHRLMGRGRVIAVTERPPILEFDDSRQAMIEPSGWFKPIDIAPVAVMTWMRDVVDGLLAEGRLVERHRFVAESAVHPIWEMEPERGQRERSVGERTVAVVLAPVGAPMAAALLEVLIALGCRQFVAVGSAGGLVEDLPVGSVVVPNGAVRDEGVSYHYLAPDRLARPDPDTQLRLKETLERHDFSVSDGLVWTTDAIFRETRTKVELRRAEGCVAIDMEAASLMSVAEFRGVPLAHAVYIADTLHGEEWDRTHLVRPGTSFRRRLFFATIEAAVTH